MADAQACSVVNGEHVLDELGAGRDGSAWPRPVNLLREVGAPPLTHLDVPPVIGEFAETFAAAGGFDATGVILSATVCAAAALDDGIRLLLPGASSHFESARLWAAIIAPPGVGKSPMEREAQAPLFELHRELLDDDAKGLRQGGSEDDDADNRPRRALLTSDATIDKLSEILADNPRGILYCVDEFDSWLGQHEAFGRDGGNRNRGEWMRLYDGGPHQVDRVRRGSFYVKNWGASVLTATTPAALRRLSRKLSADGLFQRFLTITVQPMRDRDATIPGLVVERARRAYAARIRAVFAHCADLVERPIVRLSGDASSLYEAEERRLRPLVTAATNISDGFAAHVAKHPGMLARVALTFHAIGDEILTDDGVPRHPCTANVSAATMQLAVRFMRAAYRHAYAVHAGILADGAPIELARAVARSVLADKMPTFNRREITHACRAFRTASDWQRANALATLEDFGWIEGDALTAAHGSRFAVNPRVHAQFEEEAEQHIERRRQIREALHGNE
jgi:hypothetical protein